MNKISPIAANATAPKDFDGAVRSLLVPTFYATLVDLPAPTMVKALSHWKSKGSGGEVPPSPLFDFSYYRAQRPGVVIADPVRHYIETGHAEGLSPHPLFDPAFYAEVAGGVPEGWTALGHYMQIGAKRGLSPHPLFDPAFYEAEDDGAEASNPLVAYLMQDEFVASPNALFSDAFYAAHAPKEGPSAYRGGAPLAHYVQHGARTRSGTHPLFDVAYYEKRVHEVADDEGVIKALRRMSPLAHYDAYGVSLGLSPSPFIDVDFIARQTEIPPGMDPVRHYLSDDVFPVVSPHPGIDLAHYVKAANPPSGIPSILHLMGTPPGERVSPHPAFDPIHYLVVNPDLRDPTICPILHFLSHGMREERPSNAIFSNEYVRHQWPKESFVEMTPMQLYMATRGHERLRVVFVSHDAGLTGAPGTVLRLMQDFATLPHVECIGIIARDGPRMPDFRKAGHVIVAGAPFYQTSQEHRRSIVDSVLSATEGNAPIAAVVNSAESRLMGEELARAGIPVIQLVHEAADLYPEGSFETISEHASRIVFGSQYVFDRALSAIPLPDWQAEVRGQGLQQDHVGRMPRELARRLIVDELDLPDDVFLVLGCGTVDYRKGVDFFVAAALDLLERPEGQKACFVWIGEGINDHSTLNSFIRNEIRTRDRNGRLRFIGGRTDVEPYFVGADAFLMTSRVDPFPCVSQEAMASCLPVVAFREGGGTVEMLEDVAGIVVPMNDTGAMADAVAQLMKDRAKARAMGLKGRELIRSKWRAHDYFVYMAKEVAKVSGVPEQVLFADALPPKDSTPRVYFVLDEWRPSALTARVEALVDAMSSNDGPSAEVLLTRGRFSETSASPAVAHRYLQPENVAHADGRWRTSPQAILSELQKFARDNQPAVFVLVDDDLALAGAGVLPHGVATIAFVQSSDDAVLESIYAAAQNLDEIVVASVAAEQRLCEMNPSWKQKLSAIPWDSGVRWQKLPAKEEDAPIHVRIDMADGQRVSELGALKTLLDEAGVRNRIVLHVDDMPADRLRRTARQAGFAPEDVLVAPGMGAAYELLSRSVVSVFFGSDASTSVLIRAASASGSVPIAFNADDAANDAIEHAGTGHVLSKATPSQLKDSILRMLGKEGARLRAKGFKANASVRALDVENWTALIDRTISMLAEGRTKRSMVKAVAAAPNEVSLPKGLRNAHLLPKNAN